MNGFPLGVVKESVRGLKDSFPAKAIAVTISGDERKFIVLLNDKVVNFGALSRHHVNHLLASFRALKLLKWALVSKFHNNGRDSAHRLKDVRMALNRNVVRVVPTK